MDRLPPAQRSQRLKRIAQKINTAVVIDSSPLYPPRNPPTFCVPDDERKADAILGQLKLEESQGQPQPGRLTRTFTKSSKASTYSYNELYAALSRVLDENGMAGTFEALLRRFRAIEGNINVPKKRTGVISKIRSSDNQQQPGRLLQSATRIRRNDLVQLLAPLSPSQDSLDESLLIALQTRDLAVVESLLQYGADGGKFQAEFTQATQKGDFDLLHLLLRAPKKVPEPFITQSLLLAAKNGWYPIALLMVHAGANGDEGNASALMYAVQMGDLGVATAIVMGQKPPSPVSLNRAIDHIFSSPPRFIADNYDLIDLLLCGGPLGNAANEGLLEATILANVEIIRLLLIHNADVNYNGAAAVAHAIRQNRGDLVGVLVQDQMLKPQIASELVGLIPNTASSSDKVTVLSKLLVYGASGVHCSGLLITAAEQNDLDTARLLISSRDQTGRSICSVDHDAAHCLKTAVAKNYLPMVNILLEGVPSKGSLSTALSSMPPNIRGDDQFSMIQTLLLAGVEGPAVDEALLAALNTEPKSHRLIELLVRNGAVVADPTLYKIVSQGSVDILKILLMGQVSAQACSLAIPKAMKVQNLRTRYHIINLLLGPAVSSGTGTPEVTESIVDILQNIPEDKPLLLLLCRDGKANINLQGGLAVELATRSSDLEVFNIVLKSGGCVANSDTVEKALKCAVEIETTDPNRKLKVELLLQHAKPQNAMNDALLWEIKFFLSSSKQDLAIVQVLLAAGADVNALDGAVVAWGARNPDIMDLLLSKPLSRASFSMAFQYALSLDKLARYSLCEKLMRAGAPEDPISTALSIVVKEGPPAIPFIKLLLPQADVNYNSGEAMLVVVQQAFIEGLDLLLAPRAVMPSAATKAGAFQMAMQVKNTHDRHAIVTRLLDSGIPANITSGVLVTAVNGSDLPLVEALLRSGASIEHNGGHAILCAASSGQVDILKILIGGELCDKPSMSTFLNAFAGAMTLKEKDPKACYLIVQILLDAGVRGDAVDAALTNVAKDGDANLKLSELLCKVGNASVEWNGGEALDIATQSSAIKTLNLLLEQRPSEAVLCRAYRSASQLSKNDRFRIIQLLLKAGKSIDKHVSESLTSATKEAPPDHQFIQLLLDHEAFDEGGSITNAVKTLDLETLTLLLSSPRATPYIPFCFRDAVANSFTWKSREELLVMKLLLERGASGGILGEALCKAIRNVKDSPEGLADEFVDLLLSYGADVNYHRGLALQRAATEVNVDLIQKLLPGATSDSKAVSIPYLFNSCDDPTKLVRAMQAFSNSLQEEDKIFITGFKHPDSQLDPILFMALDCSPRKPEVLKALLDLGYDPNQWKSRGMAPTLGAEPWPILCWAIEQPMKNISNTNIELLIDAGANVNFKSKSGVTPLMLAIQHNRSEIVSKLLSQYADVKAADQNGITPLSLASRLGNTVAMGHLLEAGAECDDGSLHDAACELRCDIMRVLLKYGHKSDYPSERHDGRSALAHLCFMAVNNHPTPGSALLEDAIQCLIAGGANIRLRSRTENTSEKTIFHFALDSENPMLILPVLLKIMWEYVNEDCFLYEDAVYTYSLTKYVEKDLYQGPQEQKNSILRLLKNKRVIDRFWATDVEAEQPPDWCGAPDYIKSEVIRQKLRRKQKAEEHQDTMAALDLQRLAALRKVEIMDITTAAEIRTEREKAQTKMQLLAEQAEAQMRLDTRAEGERLRLLSQRHAQESEHMRSQAAIQLSTQRALKQEGIEEERTRNMLRIEHMDAKIRKETEGRRAIMAIEDQSRENHERHDKRLHEREMARVKMQKSLVDSSTRLAGNLQGSGMTQRQIGYVTGEVP